MHSLRKTKRLIILFTLPLVLWLFFNQVAYWHYHVMDNGIVIEHAHPFQNNTQSGTPYQQHQHTDFEYTLLAQASNMISLLVFLLILGLFFNISLAPVHYFYEATGIPSGYLSALRLRGPPAIS